MSLMKAIASSPLGRRARSQEDLVRLALNKSPFKEETMDHVLSANGFRSVTENGLVRMTEDNMFGAVMNLLRARPTAHIWDVKPEYECQKTPLFIESPDAFRMSFQEKATLIADEFSRRPRMEGFYLELHNVANPKEKETAALPSSSIYVYEAEYELEDLSCPLQIWVRWRTNF